MVTIRQSFLHGRTKQAVMEREANQKRGVKKATIPQTKPMTPQFIPQADIDEIIKSPEFIEICRKDEEKKKRAEERWLVRETKREAEREERRQNPKSPIDAYWNCKESCPPYLLDPKERRIWKKANPTFEFNGVTYRAHWIPQLTNSGKNTRWMGCLIGSDGSRVIIKDDHINNRRNDPERNWGLPE